MVLHPRFIHDHLHAAAPGYIVHGKRVMLTGQTTRRVISKMQVKISPLWPGLTRRKYAWYSPLVSGWLSYVTDDWYDTQSANLSMWKDDLLKVNGFNEDFEGWGREDSELALRLIRSGLQKKELRCRIITYHLAHGKDNKTKYTAATQRNQELLEQTRSSSIIRCKNGISNHL
jgi:hypothetical protein